MSVILHKITIEDSAYRDSILQYELQPGFCCGRSVETFTAANVRSTKRRQPSAASSMDHIWGNRTHGSIARACCFNEWRQGDRCWSYTGEYAGPDERLA